MSGRPVCLALVILLALTSCDDGEGGGPIIEPGPVSPETRPAQFTLAAVLNIFPSEPGSPPAGLIGGMLDPGLDDGLPRATNDTLWVDDEPLLPERVSGPYRYYRLELSIDPGAALDRIFRARPPTVNGVSVDEISFAFVGRSGGDTLTRTPEGDLIIPILVPAALPDPPPSRTTWDVTILSGDSLWARLAGYDVPGGPLRVPGLYLPPEGSSGRVLSTVVFDRSARRRVAEDEYTSGYSVISRFVWPIAAGAPAATPGVTDAAGRAVP